RNVRMSDHADGSLQGGRGRRGRVRSAGRVRNSDWPNSLIRTGLKGWCPGEDSNLHELLHWYLKPARLPVPPPGQEGAAECEAQESTHPLNPCQFGGLEWSIAASHGKMFGSPL